MEARIISIVDAYDDARRGFSGSGPLSSEEALKEIAREAGKKYDSNLVALLEKLVKEQEPVP